MNDWFEKLPKAELHLHLEGAIPLDALWTLVRKYGGDPSVPDVHALEKKFRYRDFPHFIEIWVWKNGFLRESDDFTLIAEAVAQNLLHQNIRYAEAFFSPADFRRHGLKPQEIAKAVRRGLDRVPGTRVALVADLVRDFGPENALATLSEVNETRDCGVIGIGIGGSEQNFPPELFEKVFEQARKLGFHTSAHAGEAAGPQSVWNAVSRLNVDRIGHGTRASEDKALLHFLAEKRIPVETCPLSNVRTGVVDSIGRHPVRLFYESGIRISVNTDDPAMFGNSLAEEYRLLETKLGFSRDEIRGIILETVSSSWLPENEKKLLADRFRLDPVFNQTVPWDPPG
jgi:adenosine deaminase